MIQFPNNPTNGQLVAMSDGSWFEWNESVWLRVKRSGALPDPPDDGKTYARKDAAWVEAPVLRTALNHNMLVNGSLVVTQEYPINTVLTGNAKHVADQWIVAANGTTTPASYALKADSGDDRYIEFVIPSGTDTTALSLSQKMNPRDLIALDWMNDKINRTCGGVARFDMQAPVGRYGFTLSSPYTAVSYNMPFETQGTGWETIEIAVPSPPLPMLFGPVSLDSAYSEFRISLLASDDGTSTTGWNAIGAVNTDNLTNPTGTIRLKNFGFYPDPFNTGLAPNWEEPYICKVIKDCRQYFFRGNFPLWSASGGSPATSFLAGNMLAPMRTNPSVTLEPGYYLSSCVGPHNPSAFSVTLRQQGLFANGTITVTPSAYGALISSTLSPAMKLNARY